MNNKGRSNYIKYHEPTKLYPSNSGRININLNSYKLNPTFNSSQHQHQHKKKENSNNFNLNHNTNNKSRPRYENNHLEQMLNNLKREIVDISKNIKETDNKMDYYMNKNYDKSKKMRNNSANISKNIILLPKQNETISNKGISLDVTNSNKSNNTNNKILNYLFNNNNENNNKIKNKNINNSNNINTRLTYNLYSKKSNNNINRLTIQLNNDNILNKINYFDKNTNKNKLYNNYIIGDIRPKYHTAENFYHHDKKRKQ
jgi:hypothetical protein